MQKLAYFFTQVLQRHCPEVGPGLRRCGYNVRPLRTNRQIFEPRLA